MSEQENHGQLRLKDISQRIHLEKVIKKSNNLDKGQKFSVGNQETRLSILLVTILSSFTILTTPNTVLQCYWLWGDTKSLWTSSGFNLRLVSAPVNILLAANYSLNFYLYCLYNAEIRKSLFLLLIQLKSKFFIKS